jgi:hypothetical protein
VIPSLNKLTATVRPVAVLVAGLIAISLMSLAPRAANGSTGPGAKAAGGGIDRVRATTALRRAEAIFGGTLTDARRRANVRAEAKKGDATVALRDLFQRLDALTPAERQTARGILARPTDGNEDPYGNGYSVPATRTCQGHICLHWVTTTDDAPPSSSWVRKMLALMNHVWHVEVDTLGYRPPVTDGGRGGDNRFDVYLANIGPSGLYGYCAPERRKPGFKWLASGFCVLDNDFSPTEFPANTPIENAEVTAAHEFFHAIQFGYDFGEDVWLLEATAVWMEDRVFDQVNDNRQFLPYGQVGNPSTPLDLFDSTGSEQYGNWAFFAFLSKHFGDRIVQDVWNHAAAFPGAPDQYSTQAIRTVLAPRGGLTKIYSRFASANLLPAHFYPEGHAWPSTAPQAVETLSRDHRRTGWQGTRLLHLTSASWELKSSTSLRSRHWALRMKVDGPAAYRMPAAYVLVARRSGFEKKFVRLDAQGDGRVVVPFGRRQVRAVYVSLVDASTRFVCFRDSSYSCSGRPIDDGSSARGQRYRVNASVFKR